MGDPNEFDEPIQRIAAEQRREWLRGRRKLLESYLPQYPEIAQAEEPLLDLIYHEVRLRESMGEEVAVGGYLRRFPHLKDQLEPLFEVHSALASAFPESTLAFDFDATRPATPQRVDWPGGNQPLAIVDDSLEQHVMHRGAGDGGRERLGAIFYFREAPAMDDSSNDYRLMKELGSEGQAIVYQAQDRAEQRTIALKTLLNGPYLGSAAWTELQARVDRLRDIRHPNLVAVYGTGDLNGLPYVAMEFAGCCRLADRLQIGRCEARQAAQWTHAMASGLAALHDAGYAHGNLKPSNVLLAADGAWKLSDMSWTTILPDALNLGCIVDRPAVGQSMLEQARGLRGRIRISPHLALLRTSRGWRMGDVRYLAPDAASPDYDGPTPAEDVYALGAILYELLAGKPPFAGESAREIWPRVVGEPVSGVALAAADAPGTIERLCLRCLAKQPAERPGLPEILAILADAAAPFAN